MRVFFVFLPKGYWIFLAVALLLRLMGPAIEPLDTGLINFGLFLVFSKVATVIHETGHLTAAWLAGGTPRRMILGSGYEVYRTEIFRVTTILNNSALGGFAYATFENPKFLKWRYALFVSGGVLTNLLIACMLYLVFGFSFHDSRHQAIVSLSSSIILANALTVFNLLPFTFKSSGLRHSSDGLHLLKLPFVGHQQIKEHLDYHLLMDMMVCLEKAEYVKALGFAELFQARHPDNKIMPINTANIFLRMGKFQKCLDLCLQVVHCLGEKKYRSYSGIVYNMLAWTYLVLNDIGQADHYSSLAIKALPRESNIRGTRGSVLVEKGDLEFGMAMLSDHLDLKHANSATLAASIYLALGYHQKGNNKERDKHLAFVKTNQDKLEADAKALFERGLVTIEVNHSAFPRPQLNHSPLSNPQ